MAHTLLTDVAGVKRNTPQNYDRALSIASHTSATWASASSSDRSADAHVEQPSAVSETNATRTHRGPDATRNLSTHTPIRGSFMPSP